MLCNQILNSVYKNKFENFTQKTLPEISQSFTMKNAGPQGVVKEIQKDIQNQKNLISGKYGDPLSEYAFTREEKVLAEREREEQIFKKVLKKSSRINNLNNNKKKSLKTSDLVFNDFFLFFETTTFSKEPYILIVR